MRSMNFVAHRYFGKTAECCADALLMSCFNNQKQKTASARPANRAAARARLHGCVIPPIDFARTDGAGQPTLQLPALVEHAPKPFWIKMPVGTDGLEVVSVVAHFEQRIHFECRIGLLLCQHGPGVPLMTRPKHQDVGK